MYFTLSLRAAQPRTIAKHLLSGAISTLEKLKICKVYLYIRLFYGGYRNPPYGIQNKITV